MPSELLHPTIAQRVPRTLTHLLAGLLLAFGLQAADTPLPSVDAILQKWIDASGGRAALEKIRSRVAKGTLELVSMGVTNISFELKSKAPNKQVSKAEVEGYGTRRDGFDGKVAWEEQPGSAATEKTGTELARAQRGALFPRELKFKETYERIRVKERSTVGKATVYVVEAAPKAGDPELFHFDVQSGLLLRQDSIAELPSGRGTLEVYFEDYRTVDGVKLAFTVRMPKPDDLNMVIRLAEVKHNVDIPDAEFAKP